MGILYCDWNSQLLFSSSKSGWGVQIEERSPTLSLHMANPNQIIYPHTTDAINHREENSNFIAHGFF